MASFTIALCALLFLQGAVSGPAVTGNVETTKSDETDKTDTTKTVSIGTELSSNMNDNLVKVLDNLRAGAVQISTPVVKFGVDTVPALFTTGFKTMTDAASKIVESKKKGFGKILNGLGTAGAGGAVLGSSVVGGGLKVVGSGLGATFNIVDIAAKFGLNVTGNLAESSAVANTIMASLTNTILEGVGGGLNAVGDGINMYADGSSKVIGAIGTSISKSISNAQDTMTKWFKNGSAKLQNGAMTLTSDAQVKYYNALQWYLHNLLAMEGVMDKLTEAINSSGKTSSSDKDGKTSSSDKDASKTDSSTDDKADK